MNGPRGGVVALIAVGVSFLGSPVSGVEKRKAAAPTPTAAARPTAAPATARKAPVPLPPVEMKLEQRGARFFLVLSRPVEAVEVYLGNTLVQRCGRCQECDVTDAVAKAGVGELRFVCIDERNTRHVRTQSVENAARSAASPTKRPDAAARSLVHGTPTVAKPTSPATVQMESKPVIDAMLSAPLGALKPRSKLFLTGRQFGSKRGAVLMAGRFPGPVELDGLEWSDTRISGTVPTSMAEIVNQTVKILVKRADGKTSEPKEIGFQGRVEYRCDGKGGIYGSDGSFTDCSPYNCHELAGTIQCYARCTHGGHCANLRHFACDPEEKCIPWTY